MSFDLTEYAILPSGIAVRAAAFWKAVTLDRSDFLESLIALFAECGIRYCVIGGQGVAVDNMDEALRLLAARFTVERFEHSLNIAAVGSNLRVQIQTDPRYFPFVERDARREVLGISLPLASVEDVLQAKIWAASDSTPRPTKRRKDLLDMERILESYPHLRERVPPVLLSTL